MDGAGIFCIFLVELVYFNQLSGGVCISPSKKGGFVFHGSSPHYKPTRNCTQNHQRTPRPQENEIDCAFSSSPFMILRLQGEREGRSKELSWRRRAPLLHHYIDLSRASNYCHIRVVGRRNTRNTRPPRAQAEPGQTPIDLSWEGFPTRARITATRGVWFR